MADAFRVHDVELGLPERRRHFVLHHFNANVGADDVLFFLDRSDATDVESQRRVELQRLAARGRLGISKHHADLLAQLIDEDHRRARPGDRPGELAERLTHQTRLKSHVTLAHVALDLRLGYERGD